ncbi:hypothetical protein SH1V18_14620 [Vallitalea longa]|uniref:Flagellar operon protein n=1 Tax=Vallitalea longa TaxID=2936439 RepID=A0A9W6DF03_9FIRM|nr:TIGR02530 family flagellar biosynthesis protein [Vallitalea longa]GKX28982.1 hypothetical protein SH1V18_14620 [Vallitalea longa]
MKINPSMYNVSKIKPNSSIISTTNNTNAKINQFDNVLQDKLNKSNELNFSKHANMRLDSRNIKLSNDQLARINKGVDNAKGKGIKDSLIIVDDVALVVNIKNKTVITAMGKTEQDDKVFTNIDGAVII